jgi:hypothetical protein
MARLQGKSTKKSYKHQKTKTAPVVIPPSQSRLEKLISFAVGEESGGAEKEKSWLEHLELRYHRTGSVPFGSAHFERWAPQRITYPHKEEVILYHGTHVSNFATVLVKGFKRGSSSCLFGSGIYLADIYKAMGYSSGCADVGWGVLFKCAVNLGRVYEAGGSLKHCPANFDSVYGKAGKVATWNGVLQRDEYCVYDPKRIRILEIWIRKDNPSKFRPV